MIGLINLGIGLIIGFIGGFFVGVWDFLKYLDSGKCESYKKVEKEENDEA